MGRGVEVLTPFGQKGTMFVKKHRMTQPGIHCEYESLVLFYLVKSRSSCPTKTEVHIVSTV